MATQTIPGYPTVAGSTNSAQFVQVQTIYNEANIPSGTGMWAGVFYFITGYIGIRLARNTSRCCLNAYLTMCVVACFVAGIAFASAIISALLEASCVHIPSYCFDYWRDQGESPSQFNETVTDYCDDICLNIETKGCIFEALIAVITLLEFVVAIVAAVYCCRTICCPPPVQTGYGFPSHGQAASNYPQQQVLVGYPQQQPMGYPQYAPPPGSYAPQQSSGYYEQPYPQGYQPYSVPADPAPRPYPSAPPLPPLNPGTALPPPYSDICPEK